MTIFLKALHERRDQLKVGLAQTEDFRRGSNGARCLLHRRLGTIHHHCGTRKWESLIPIRSHVLALRQTWQNLVWR